MKTPLLASLTAILLASAAAPAMAHERYPDADWSNRHRYDERARCEEPEVLFDRYGNKVVFVHGRRHVILAEERCHRAPVVMPECHHAPGQFSPPFAGGLRLIFPR